MTEIDAICLAKTGDSNAFAELYNLHRPEVYNRCRQILKSPEEAEDLTQDVFLALFTKIGQFGGNSSFSTWLFRLTTNKVLMHIRADKLRNRTDDVEYPEPYTLPDQLARLELDQMLNQLSSTDLSLLDNRNSGYKFRELGVRSQVGRRAKKIRSGLKESKA